MSVAWSDMDLSSNSRRTSTQPLPLRVVPPTQPWAYGAIIPFSTAEAVAGTTIRMEVVVSNTQAGFGLLGPDARDFIVRQFLEPKAEPQMVELTVPSTMEQVGPLIIQNGAREGSAQVVIESVRATRPIEAPTPQP
jgi:hypothetical protein